MPYKPREFVRKLRPLQFIKRFNATVLREIFIYAGTVVFKQVLPKELYEHFLVLHVGMTLLVNPSFCHTNVDFAEELLQFWVASFKSVYWAAYVSHNMACCTVLLMFAYLDLMMASVRSNLRTICSLLSSWC